jgi:hypothetical protein
MTPNLKKIKLHCNGCLGERWHSVRHFVQKIHTENDIDEYIYEETCKYRLAECDGCEHISLHMEWRSSSHSDWVISQWPPKMSRRKPKWMIDLFFSDNVSNPLKQEFFNEIYTSLESNNLRLAVLGIRALLEHVMIDSVGDHNSFENNLKKMHENGFISKLQKEAIEPIIEAGHASMHRGFKASAVEVEACLDVVENLIESIYISNVKSAKLEVPKRALKLKKKTST